MASRKAQRQVSLPYLYGSEADAVLAHNFLIWPWNFRELPQIGQDRFGEEMPPKKRFFAELFALAGV